ncbi:hypothetical protein GCM10009603_48980 [Nocardiopsis exhalans]
MLALTRLTGGGGLALTCLSPACLRKSGEVKRDIAVLLSEVGKCGRLPGFWEGPVRDRVKGFYSALARLLTDSRIQVVKNVA